MKTRFTGFSPNSTKGDIKKALSFLISPSKWKNWYTGEEVNNSEVEIKKYFGVPYAYTFDSGRSALYIALSVLGVEKGDEVLVQAFTCGVVINAITYLGALPVFVDIQDDYNINTKEIEGKISKKTKIIIIQHTFGTFADVQSIIEIAKKHNISTIEDCAHAYGTRQNGQLAGTFADIGMFSFGSDKVLSCVRGGALITQNTVLAKKIWYSQSQLRQIPFLILTQHLLHYPIFWVGKKFYHIYIGKLILYIAKKFHLINTIISPLEKNGQQELFLPAKLPNALAAILLNQLRAVDENIVHRRTIAKIYSDNLGYQLDSDSVYLRFPVQTKDKNSLINSAKKKHILLGDWYRYPVAPIDFKSSASHYKNGMCPNAERLSKNVVNLPTNQSITEHDAIEIAELVKRFIAYI